MADRDAWERPLYCFARLLFENEAAARQAVMDTLEAGLKRRPPHIEADKLVMLQFQRLRSLALNGRTATRPERAQPEELPVDAPSVLHGIDTARLPEVLRALPEPGRSAYALLLLDAMESEWIAKLLGLTPGEFADTVQGARLAVHRAIVTQSQAAAQ